MRPLLRYEAASDESRPLEGGLTPIEAAVLLMAQHGAIALPLVRIEYSHKCAKGVALIDLAAYIDRRVEAARTEGRQLTGHG